MACKTCDPNSVTLLKGDTGATGPAGADGIYGGYSSDWLFDAGTGTGPSATFIRANNADLSIATELYIARDNADSVNMNPFLTSFTNSGDYGIVRLFDETDSSKFAMYTVTGVTDNTTYFTITISLIQRNGSFSANDPVVVTFTPSGATGSNGSNGSNGADGADGTTLLYNSTADNSSNNSGTLQSILILPSVIPANTLTSNGDRVIFSGVVVRSGARASNGIVGIFVSIDGTTNIIDSSTTPDLYLLEGYDTISYECIINRISATEASVVLEMQHFYGDITTPSTANGTANVKRKRYNFALTIPSTGWDDDQNLTIRGIDTPAEALVSKIATVEFNAI